MCRTFAMASSRLMLVRGSIVLNACLLIYLCMNWFSHSSPTSSKNYHGLEDEIRLADLISTGGSPLVDNSISKKVLISSLSSKFNNETPNNNGEDLGDPEKNDMLADGINLLEQQSKEAPGEKAAIGGAAVALPDNPQELHDDDTVHLQEPPREVQERAGAVEHLVAAAIATEAPDPPLDSMERKMFPDLRDCLTRSMTPFYSQRGDYWVLENYIPAAMSFRCDESVTYTTHGDYTFLDNLETLTSRWQGPVSIGVYAPGADFEPTINTVMYLRDCWAEGIKKFVTFHLIYHTNHIPKKIPSTEELMQRKTDCSVDPPKWQNVTTYRQQKKLLYPVNVARNVARRLATTYFVFPSDVELYPSINFIPEFFKMLKRPDFTNTTVPKVFVFPIFEVEESVSPPETKSELLAMINNKKAIPFHKKVCARCHNQPHSQQWLKDPVRPGLSVVNAGKRLGEFKKWEPIYVGTHKEPLYDERLSWEGKSDKMTQMYILCVRDYEFHILDNAFLVHRPGIKHITKDPERDKQVAMQNRLISKHILPEYKILFGTKPQCVV